MRTTTSGWAAPRWLLWVRIVQAWTGRPTARRASRACRNASGEVQVGFGGTSLPHADGRTGR
ncbi:hypothetical protein ACFQGX_05775 [Nonomuraea dietziae]|uniref:hypothetical protein n=1 Tax=Nonomuraea dietziae TaxID=65515 RepID=UPI0036177539